MTDINGIICFEGFLVNFQVLFYIPTFDFQVLENRNLIKVLILLKVHCINFNNNVFFDIDFLNFFRKINKKIFKEVAVCIMDFHLAISVAVLGEDYFGVVFEKRGVD